MKRFIGQRGFTLVELAIVLVIIGIILGAVLKGQDLIQGARSKKFITDSGRKFEVAAWGFYDRKGKFPGGSTSGTTAGMITGNVYADYSTAKLTNMPSTSNPVTIGSYQFYTYYGNDNNGAAGSKNVMVICKDIACTSKFTADELGFMQAFDTAIDGLANGTTGLIKGATGVGTVTQPQWLVAGPIVFDATDWNTNDVALVYYFDRK